MYRRDLCCLISRLKSPSTVELGQLNARLVLSQEACAESGLLVGATPFLQVIMVVKELLAQRKLNKPYSCGLSRYALLLLVLALVRDVP